MTYKQAMNCLINVREQLKEQKHFKDAKIMEQIIKAIERKVNKTNKEEEKEEE